MPSAYYNIIQINELIIIFFFIKTNNWTYEYDAQNMIRSIIFGMVWSKYRRINNSCYCP